MAPRTTTEFLGDTLAASRKEAHKQADVAKKEAEAGPASRRWNPTSLTWTEKYSDSLEKTWVRFPLVLRKIFATLAVFATGLAMSGDWIVIMVHLRRQFGLDPVVAEDRNIVAATASDLVTTYLKGYAAFWIGSSIVSYGMYFLFGGFLHWYFYVRQRQTAAEWKCQPNSWLNPELEVHSMKVGVFSLMVTGSFSAALSCYISNGGWSQVYYKLDEFGWPWLFLQIPIVFLYQDYTTYWLHRMYHTPFLYKHFHKLHHTYKHPTAFSVTAIHPVEMLHIQITLCLPLFAFPVHWAPFYFVAIYTYVHGILDHSGINFKAYWWQPWQPDTIFHDNHHQYFHVNFGFNCFLWDMIHGTYRRKDRVYTEDIFYGQGKPLSEATQEEIAQDMKERTLENPKAFRNDVMEFAISEEEVKAITTKKES